MHVDCQPKLSQPPQGQAPDRSSGSLDCAEMPNKGEGLVNCQRSISIVMIAKFVASYTMPWSDGEMLDDERLS